MKIYGNPEYEQLFASKRNWRRYPSEEAIRFFIPYKIKTGKQIPLVLDIGCGGGGLSWFIAKEIGTVHAFDGSPACVNNVLVLAGEFGVAERIKVINGDITMPLNFLEDTYDMMLDHYSIYANHEEAVVRAYEQYYQILNPQGYFLTCLCGDKSSGLDTAVHLYGSTYTGFKTGKLAEQGVQTVFNYQYLENLFNMTGFQTEYYENIMENRNGIYLEKHIFCLRK